MYLMLMSALLLFNVCNECGSDVSNVRKPIGINGIQTSHYYFGNVQDKGHYDSLNVMLDFDFKVASANISLGISSAVACTPVIPSIDFSPFVDSILVFSDKPYTNGSAVLTHILSVGYDKTLVDVNRNNFDIGYNKMGVLNFRFSKPPSEADTFALSFYVFKGGAIIDSTTTAPIFITP